MIIPGCPDCSGTNVSLLCKVWLHFTDGIPELDGEDGDFAEPFPEPSNNAVCHDCEHTFTVR
jgi:hypothetical protein